MKIFLNDLISYIKKVFSKWTFWVLAILDLIFLVAQIFTSSFQLPQYIYISILLLGYFWSNYQVYRDNIAQLPSQPTEPSLYQLLPITFTIDLRPQIPQIEIWFYIVNYQAKEIVLERLNVINFHFYNGPLLSNIPISTEGSIKPKETRKVVCRRNLLDTEIRILENLTLDTPVHGLLEVFAHSLIGKNKVSKQSINSVHINGWLFKK